MNDKWKIAMKILDFLSRHGKEVNTPGRWADLIGFTIIDADGWTRDSWLQPIDLPTFIEKVSHATIGPERQQPAASIEEIEPFPLPDCGRAERCS